MALAPGPLSHELYREHLYASNRSYTRVWRPPGSDHFLGAQLYANRILPRLAQPRPRVLGDYRQTPCFPPDPAKQFPLNPDALFPSVTGPGVLNPERFVLTKTASSWGSTPGPASMSRLLVVAALDLKP